MTQEIVEVRDYTVDTEWLEAYRQWATELAVPWLREHLDLVDFWMDDGYDAEVSGTNAVPPANGQLTSAGLSAGPVRPYATNNLAPSWRNKIGGTSGQSTPIAKLICR